MAINLRKKILGYDIMVKGYIPKVCNKCGINILCKFKKKGETDTEPQKEAFRIYVCKNFYV